MIEMGITFLIIMLAGVVQGMTSFGFSLIAVPLLGIILPLKAFVPMLVLFSLLMNLALFKNLKGSFEVKRIIVLVCAGLATTSIGIGMLKYVSDGTLKLVVGIVIVISAIAMSFGLRIKIKNKVVGDIIAGVFSGILNGSVSLSGPPVILLLSNEDTEKEVFRKTLTTFFLVLNFVSLPMFFMNGLLTFDVIKLSAANLPALGLGLFLGLKAGEMFSEKHFKTMTLGLIFVMGIMSLTSAVF